MVRPLKVVVVGDVHSAALRVAEDFEKSGYEPAVFLAPSEAELERIAPGCEMVVAWADATTFPPSACWRSPRPTTASRRW